MTETMMLVEAVTVGAAAIIATNLDNLLLSINMSQASSFRRVSVIFLGIQLFVIALAFGVSQGLEALPLHWVGYLGILPILLGVRELLRNDKGATAVPAVGSAVVLASNSGDSLAVLVVTFSDEVEAFDPAMAIGACMAAVMLTILLALISRWGRLKRYLAPIARKVQPWLMILIGLLVLMDTPFDVQ